MLAGNKWEADAPLAEAPSWTRGFRSGLESPDVLGVLSAGIDIASTDLMTLRPQYDGNTASDQTTHAGELRIRYRFWAVAGW